MTRNSLLVTCIAGMALTGAVLILLVPSLFNSGGQSNIWLTVGLGFLFLVFAAGSLRWKPPAPTTNVDR